MSTTGIKISKLGQAALPVQQTAVGIVVQGGVTKQAAVNLMQVLGVYSIFALPSAVAGTMVYVTDDIGGPTVAFFDGTHWRRITDRAILAGFGALTDGPGNSLTDGAGNALALVFVVG